MRANHAGQARRAQAPRGLSDDTDGAVRGVEDADDHFLRTVIGAGPAEIAPVHTVGSVPAETW
jgi:hypothetical protein